MVFKICCSKSSRKDRIGIMFHSNHKKLLFYVLHPDFLLYPVNQIMPLCSGWFQSLRYFYAEGHAWQSLTWTQRISAAIGVARGIQFLHTGIVPGVFSNNLKITDILLDQNLVAKISSYNLPLLAENAEKVKRRESSFSSFCPSFPVPCTFQLICSLLHLCRLVM